jgi:hypothetical protein
MERNESQRAVVEWALPILHLLTIIQIGECNGKNDKHRTYRQYTEKKTR